MVKGQEKTKRTAWLIDGDRAREVRVAPVFQIGSGKVDPDHVWVLEDDPDMWAGEYMATVGAAIFRSQGAAEAVLASRVRVVAARLGPFDEGLLERAGWTPEDIRHLQRLDPTATLLLALELFDGHKLAQGMTLGPADLISTIASVTEAIREKPTHTTVAEATNRRDGDRGAAMLSPGEQ